MIKIYDKILFYFKEFHLVITDKVPSYIPFGKRNKWILEQEEFVPSFVKTEDLNLWNQNLKKATKQNKTANKLYSIW